MAKGYAQKQGVHYDEVFAPVARLETVRLILAMAANGGWEVHHMDVHQPPGFEEPNSAGMVLKLNKALYGLK